MGWTTSWCEQEVGCSVKEPLHSRIPTHCSDIPLRGRRMHGAMVLNLPLTAFHEGLWDRVPMSI